jgi:hypothetical protein
MRPEAQSERYTESARIPHTCASCRKTILVGEPLWRFNGKYQGKWSTYKLCDRCWRIYPEVDYHYRPDGVSFESTWCAYQEMRR